MTDPEQPAIPPDPSSGSAAEAPLAETPPVAPAGAPGSDESPTQAWPSLAAPAAAPAAPAGTPSPSMPPVTPAAAGPWEPSTSLPSNRVDRVGDTGTFGAPVAGPTSGRGRGLRWAIAIIGVVLVAAVSVVIVSLVGAKPATSVAMGYLPADVMSYTEIRLDLPGDQRQKLASFLKPIPGFSDSSQFDTKLDELYDQLLAAASQNQVLWTRDIAPWFGGQIGIGTKVPSSTLAAGRDTGTLIVVTIKDRAKTIAWLEKIASSASLSRSTYGAADLLTPAAGNGSFAVGVTDQVLLAGSSDAVKAAVDTGGKGTWATNGDVEAALATVDKDYVTLGVTRVKELATAFESYLAQQSPGTLDRTQVDETVLAMLPAWFANSGRFENDAFVTTSVGPAGNVGSQSANHADGIVGHIPASTLLVASEHDVGPTLAAILAKFRALPETKDFFSQLDQGLALAGGFDAVFGWWGDSALVVAKLDDDTVGGGLVIKPTDAAAANRLLTSLSGFVSLGGASAGVTTRTVDHNGTKVTIVDASQVAGMGSLPPGYKAEIAWASNADVAVIGYGESFVDAVLDAGPGHSLADDARFKGLLDRVGPENIALTFIDIKAIRTLLEPIIQAAAPADVWIQYTGHLQPFLQPIDALIATGRKDGSNDRGVTIITTPR